jgi:ATP-dependent helicase HrpB
VAARRELGDATPRDDDEAILRALLAGYPDRVAIRREPGSPRMRLATGTGAILSRESGVREAEWIVAVDLVAGPRGQGSEAIVDVASAVERDWLTPTSRDIVHRFDDEAEVVRATARERYLELTLKEGATTPDAATAAALLVQAIRRRGLGEAGDQVIRRIALARLPFEIDAALEAACAGAIRLPAMDESSLVPHSLRRDLDRLAPETIEVPSGRRLRLEYRADGEVVLPVKIQELFGLAETPLVGPDRTPVLLVLLAPNGRPVQQTRDLRGFWERTYAEVRKELRSRYPRHPWPEDPWSAQPTHRAKPRRRS